jgi:hypothetical protein
MTRTSVFLTICLLAICCAIQVEQASATTTCAYNFSTGSNNPNGYLTYCVTANGNIQQIETPYGQSQLGPGGEGYGICNESPAQNYTDYGIGDTGNWNAATVLRNSASSVKIARTTSDGNWTLTQTITVVPLSASSPQSINVVMALKNNQAVAKVAYLVRYAEVCPLGACITDYGATLNSTFGYYPAYYGLQLQNVGTPQFGYWQAIAQTVPQGPNACAFAYNDSGGYFYGQGSNVMAYVTDVPAHGTKTATMTYRGL